MTSSLRFTQSLDGLWDFTFLGPIDLTACRPCEIISSEKMLVPSAFDALPAYAGKRGAAVYRTTFATPPGRPARLDFAGISIWARVYVDGQMVAEQPSGYSPFHVDLPPASQGIRDLVVLVDNRFDFARSPMHEEYFDFYQYGGIIRPVTLTVLPAHRVFVDTVQVFSTAHFREGAVEVKISLSGSSRNHVAITTQFDGGPTRRHAMEAVAGDSLKLALTVPDPHPWSPASPFLHRLRVALVDGNGEEMDDLQVRFGLRTVEARDGALFLNGERLILRGYNRHEWHPSGGPSTSPWQMFADLQYLRDLGCNFVRGSHYPQDQRFLDLCDEMGFLVWEENLGWGQGETTFASEKFARDHAASLRTMVRASFNHPSVIIWGFLNEAKTDQIYTRPIFEETVKALRELDGSRLISYASNRPFTDRHFDLVDVISLNVYPGWYECVGVEEPLGLIDPFIAKCLAHLDETGWREKPVLVTEIGCEGLYGWHEAHDGFFSEEYQAKYLVAACEAVLGRGRASGIALWHFSDVRTYSGGRSLMRPRTFNNKGTLDEYRRPKAAYPAVRAVFRKYAETASPDRETQS